MYRVIFAGLRNNLLKNICSGFKIAGSWFALLILFGYGIAALDAKLHLEAIAVTNQVFSLFAASSIAGAWYRLVLLGERPRLIHLRFRRRELGIFARRLKLTLLAMPLLLLGIFCVILASRSSETTPHQISTLAAWMTVVLFGLAAIYLEFRFAFILPSFAIERPVPLKEAFRLSKGYFLATVAAVSTIIVPVLLGLGIALGLKQFVAPVPFKPDDYVWLLPVVVLFQILLASIFAVAIAVSYCHATSGRLAENPNNPTSVGS
ncbi:MAG: hypothetical protein ACK4NV_05305 [Pannonibacter sp.]